MYIEFIEHNSWEGETWSAFVKADDPLCQRLVKVIDRAFECGLCGEDIGLEYKKVDYDDNAVESLCSRDEGNYMARYFKASISKGELEKAEKLDFSTFTDEDCEMINYKMSMFE